MAALEMAELVAEDGGKLRFAAHPQKQPGEDPHGPIRCHRRIEDGRAQYVDACGLTAVRTDSRAQDTFHVAVQRLIPDHERRV